MSQKILNHMFHLSCSERNTASSVFIYISPIPTCTGLKISGAIYPRLPAAALAQGSTFQGAICPHPPQLARLPWPHPLCPHLCRAPHAPWWTACCASAVTAQDSTPHPTWQMCGSACASAGGAQHTYLCISAQSSTQAEFGCTFVSCISKSQGRVCGPTCR